MREKKLTTVPPSIRDDEFEDYLATDDMLVDFFNEFLNLPTFAEPVKFNPDFGVFEVTTDAPQHLENQLKKMLREKKPRNPIYDVIRPAKQEIPDLRPVPPPPPVLNFDPNYSTMCLDREQAIAWIKKERFPSFLESDCYFEYRLAKLISQVEWSRTGVNIVIDKTYYPWFSKSLPPSEASEENENDLIMKKFYVSLGQATVTQTRDWFTLAKLSQRMITTDSFPHPVASSHVHFSPWPSESSSVLDFRGVQGMPSVSSTVLHAAALGGAEGKNNNMPELETKMRKKRAQSGISLLQRVVARRSIDEGHSLSLPDTPSSTVLRAYVGQDWDAALQAGKSKELDQQPMYFQTVDEFSLAYAQYILRSSVAQVTGQPPEASPTAIDFDRMSRVFIVEVANIQPFVEPLEPKTLLPADDILDKGSEISTSTKSEKDSTESRAAWCLSHKTYDIGNRHEFERFKRFIKGTLGERYLRLWMDIERLKVLRDPKRQRRQLDKMKKIYLVSNGDYFLTTEVLMKLNLIDGDQWNMYNLRRAQPEVVKPLLLYWGPRFCVIHTGATQAVSTKLKIWHSRQQKPRMDVDPFPQMVSLLPLRAKSCMPKIAQPQRGEMGSSPPPKGAMLDQQMPSRLLSAVLPRSQSAIQEDPTLLLSSMDVDKKRPATAHMTTIPDKTDYLMPKLDRKYTYAEMIPGTTTAAVSELGSSVMERMLQSLNVESRSGYIFTEFCEKSKNKLWKNSTYFWFDLQDYHQLFYQETIHPFKVGQQAQFLYANYIAPSASMDIGLQQITKSEIYQKIEPPFEDLFDSAEEYILTLLLDPWMKMVEQDRKTYGQVELVEETRQLDSVYFRKLQALHGDSISKKDEVSAVKEEEVPLHPEPTVVTEPPSQALPEEVTSYSIQDLLKKKLELEAFRTFLEQQSASIDLTCWLDIEQFRRMLHRNKELREAKSKDIKNKYLNRKYFFGPGSPATKMEQEQIMKSNGGWGYLLHEQVVPVILLEVQKYVQRRLEKQWMPLFYASEESGPQTRVKPHFQDAAEDILIQRLEKRAEAWKHLDSKWVSSSREIITFRKALLNPITAYQFQRYVSLKGDLLENGVIFWQEVQKYKDLCHSHCDSAIIQNKITTIINCFIDSAIPPALQIDIPEEQAQKIIEHRKELGPYVFREAQMTIFALLFKFWPQFCEFRSNLADEKILPILEKRREKKLRKTRETDDGALGKKTPMSVKMGSVLESKMSKSEISSSPSFTEYGRQAWSYSKYLEALQQERVLLKIQDELDKKSIASSAYTELSNFLTLKSDQSEKPMITTTYSSAFVKQRLLHPKDSERTPKL
ncbi:regulator of G-protein signaling 22 isoform X2 [Zootoca vivipara]|uniref:regulator of G-protein signaling 22 isoform X2 n=1 Tax=Zootoca vivipara TaxID=8524 RepID=UPI00293BFB48|nr:regulator of G-protein signaling 22 isoform X2 [Zootoca vivipara]